VLGPPSKTIALFILVAAIALPTALAPTVLAYDGQVDSGIHFPTWDDFKQAAWNIFVQPLINAFNWLIDQIKSVIGSVFGGIADSVRSFFAGLGTALWDAIQAPFNALKSAWSSVDRFINWLPDYAKPAAPLIITGVVAAVGYMIWWIIRAIVPGI